MMNVWTRCFLGYQYPGRGRYDPDELHTLYWIIKKGHAAPSVISTINGGTS